MIGSRLGTRRREVARWWAVVSAAIPLGNHRLSLLPSRLAHLSERRPLIRIAPDVYLCGPAPWMAAVRAGLREARVPAGQIPSEDFRW